VQLENEQKEDDHKKDHCDAEFDAPLKCSSSPWKKAKIIDELLVRLKNEQKEDDKKKDYCDAESDAPLKCSCSPSSLMNSSCSSRTSRRRMTTRSITAMLGSTLH